MSDLLCAGEERPGPVTEEVVLAAVGILARPVASAAQQQQAFRLPEGQPVPVNAQVDMLWQPGRIQGDDIAALLVHPGKVPAGDVHEGVMAGKNDVLRPDCSPIGVDAVVLHGEHAGVFADVKAICDRLQECQRMKPGLIPELQCPRNREGQFRLPGE